MIQWCIGVWDPHRRGNLNEPLQTGQKRNPVGCVCVKFQQYKHSRIDRLMEAVASSQCSDGFMIREPEDISILLKATQCRHPESLPFLCLFSTRQCGKEGFLLPFVRQWGFNVYPSLLKRGVFTLIVSFTPLRVRDVLRGLCTSSFFVNDAVSVW